jgi:hypothetical protein
VPFALGMLQKDPGDFKLREMMLLVYPDLSQELIRIASFRSPAATYF